MLMLVLPLKSNILFFVFSVLKKSFDFMSNLT